MVAQALQHTLAGPAVCAGVGVHGGLHVRIAIRPAPADTGIVFIRTDISDRDNVVRVAPDTVAKTQLVRPKKPIVFYVENTFPAVWKAAMKEGSVLWSSCLLCV